MITFPITRKDLRIDWFSGQGAGGQHRNKHQNCCRITHIASGLSAVGQTHRSRAQNRRDAFRRLALLIIAKVNNGGHRDRQPSTEVIRTYNVPDNRVKDKLTGHTATYDSVVSDISEMIEARALAMRAKE